MPCHMSWSSAMRAKKNNFIADSGHVINIMSSGCGQWMAINIIIYVRYESLDIISIIYVCVCVFDHSIFSTHATMLNGKSRSSNANNLNILWKKKWLPRRNLSLVYIRVWILLHALTIINISRFFEINIYSSSTIFAESSSEGIVRGTHTCSQNQWS